MSRIIILIILIAVIAGGIYLANQNEPAADEPMDNQTSDEVVVTYTDAGYSPASVRVKVGTKVIFRNESSRAMWTASDVHPTHEILPEFDPRRGNRPGEEYTHTFTAAGTWQYHNHLRASDTGVIIVEE